MDRLDALIAIAQLRLRLTILEKHPHLLEGIDEMEIKDMEIKRPMALAGLKSRLQRAKSTEVAIEVTGKRYDAVLDKIDALHGVSKNNVGQLELYSDELKGTIEGMIGGSNGDPNAGDGQDGQTSKVGQIITSKDVGKVEDVVAADTKTETAA